MSKIDAGRKAELLLNNETFESAVKRVRSNYIKQLENTLPEESKLREYLYLKINVIKDIVVDLKSQVDSGMIEQRKK